MIGHPIVGEQGRLIQTCWATFGPLSGEIFATPRRPNVGHAFLCRAVRTPQGPLDLERIATELRSALKSIDIHGPRFYASFVITRKIDRPVVLSVRRQ